MTVGANIQKYRKELGLSQEELGQKLLVSRQTISLWEKDQTMPTIDNLIRLRELFAVSVDEILGIENKENLSETEPIEAYRFNYTKTELNEIYRLQRKNIYKRPVLLLLISGLMIISLIGSSAQNHIIGFAFGTLFFGLGYFMKVIRAYNKNRNATFERICESTYEYKIFEDYIGVNIYRNNEKMRESKCYYTDIEQMQHLGKWLLFQFGGQSFILRKSDLKENSVFFSYMYKNPSKTIEISTPVKWKLASVIVFVASLISIFMALALESAISSKNHLFTENMWVFFLFAPIPIASIVLGFALRSKGYKYKKNIVVGIIMTILLCTYGSFTFIFAESYDHSDEPILRIEQMIGIDIPEHKQIITQDWTTKGTQSNLREYIYSTSDVYFDDAVTEELEKQLAADEKWLSSIPNDLIGITSLLSGHGGYDFILIYCIDTSEYNTLPRDSGTFRFINILFLANSNQIRIIEYSMKYVK